MIYFKSFQSPKIEQAPNYAEKFEGYLFSNPEKTWWEIPLRNSPGVSEQPREPLTLDKYFEQGRLQIQTPRISQK